jgi:hypothetical protein
MNWHGYYMRGMWGRWGSDPAAGVMSQRMAQLGINMHDSPYEDYDAANIAVLIKKLPPAGRVFVCGTSLGCCDVAVVCQYVGDRAIDGAFGFQASIYGAKGYPLNKNIKFAHLIYSYNPIPFPGLGAYKWPLGTMNPLSYHKTPHHIPHPGDYDVNDQNMFLAEMKRIMEHTT